MQSDSSQEKQETGAGRPFIEDSRHLALNTWPASKKKRVSYDLPEEEFDYHRALQRFANAVIRGAATGFCLRGGLHLLSLLFALTAKKRRREKARRDNLLGQLQDTLRYTSFLGSFAGVFVAVDEGIAALFGKKRTATWRAAAAGAAAGPTILLTGPKHRHTSLALYILLRGVTLLVRCGNQPTSPPWLRRLLALSRWRHGDTALMCLSTSQIGYSWLIMPQTLPPAYVRFLNKHGGKELYHYRAVQELAVRNREGRAPAPLRALRGTPHQDFAGTTPCCFLHPGQPCGPHLITYAPQAYLRALPVYLPVYILPAILVHRQRLLDAGTAPQLWAKVCKGAARSSLFLALYCTFAWGGACVGWNLAGTNLPWLLAASCWTGGLATLVEKKTRRMELALYCLSRAMESFALCLGEWGYVRRDVLPRRLDVMIFSAATAAILHCYSDANGRHRDVFRSKYLNVLDFILGNTGVREGSIMHVPSTSDLLMDYANIDPAGALKRRAASWAGALEQYEGGSPRSDASDRQMLDFRQDLPRLQPRRSGDSVPDT